MLTKAEYDLIPENEKMNSVLEGTFYFSSVHSPNMSGVKNFDGPPIFTTKVGLDKENQEKAKKMGLVLKEPDDFIPEYHVQIKRKVKEGQDPEEVKPLVVDERQNVIPKSVLIGNGSKGLVKFGTYWHRSSDKWGVGTVFFKMQVTDLVPFVPPQVDPSLKMNEDGFNIQDYLSGGSDIVTENSEDQETNSKVKKEKDVELASDLSDLFDD